jgi:hypothetical protein
MTNFAIVRTAGGLTAKNLFVLLVGVLSQAARVLKTRSKIEIQSRS